MHNMDIKLAKYHSFRDLINKMLFWSGVWPYPEDTVFLYRIFTFMAILMCSAHGAKLVNFCLENVNEVSVFVQGLSTAFGMYTLLLKMGSFLLYRDDLVLLDKELGFTFERELKDKANRPVLLEGLSVYSRLLYFVSGLVTIAAILFYNVPIIHVFKHKKYELIFEGDYPFPVVPASPLYWVLLLYEGMAMWFTIHVTNGVDNAFGLSLKFLGQKSNF